jgi:hypothetical protein
MMLLYNKACKDTDTSGLLYEKFEAHRKLMRYEQRAFNQLRKISQIKKLQNEATVFGVR